MLEGQLSQIEAKVTQYSKLPLVESILDRLRNELSSCYTYHSLEHTREVIREVITYATFDGLEEREIELLAVAAAYHDAGFLYGPENHEERGAELAVRAMEQSGVYTLEEAELVKNLILETRIPVSESRYWTRPQNSLACYLLDADVSNLGRDDFFEKTEALGRELHAERDSFRRQALAFAEVHRWFTLAAKYLRQRAKGDNLRRLREELGQSQLLDEQKETVLNEIGRALSPAADFYENIGTVLYSIRQQLKACSVSLTLGNGRTAWLSFLSRADTAVRGREPGRRLFTDSRFATWIIEPVKGEQLASAHEILTVPLPYFSLETDGYLQVIGIQSQHRFSQQDIPFLEECADLISLSLSSCYREVDLRRRASARLSTSLSTVSAMRQRLVLKPLFDMFRWRGIGELPRLPVRLRELYDDLFVDRAEVEQSDEEGVLTVGDFAKSIQSEIVAVCLDRGTNPPEFEALGECERDLRNTPATGLGVVRAIFVDLVQSGSYGSVVHFKLKADAKQVALSAEFYRSDKSHSGQNSFSRKSSSTCEVVGNTSRLLSIFQEAKWLVFELPAVVDVTFTDDAPSVFRITIEA